MVDIREVRTKSDRKRFFRFPAELYRDNEYFVPALIADETDTFNPKRNPAYEYADAWLWLAERNGRVVGRIGAILNRAANRKENARQLRFTRFDFVDDPEVSQALFDTVIRKACELGMTELIGPLGFSNLDHQGMLIEGFDQPDMYITLYNHPYYVAHAERLGLTRKWDWIERKIFLGEEMPEAVARVSEICRQRYGYKLRRFKSMRQVRPFIRPAMRIINSAFEKLHGIVPLSDGQIDKFSSLIMLIGFPEYCLMVTDSSDNVVAFGFMAPSISDAVRPGHGRLGLLTLLRILESRHDHTHLDMYMIAVRPEDQHKGVETLIMSEGMLAASRHGCADLQTGPMLEDNIKVQNIWKRWDNIIHRRRRCWTYTIPQTNDCQ